MTLSITRRRRRPLPFRRALVSLEAALLFLHLSSVFAGAAEPSVVFVSRRFGAAQGPIDLDRLSVVERARSGSLLLRERDGTFRTLVDATGAGAPPGAPADVADPDVSFDASRIVFSGYSPDERAWRIYEIGADGAGLRKITGSDRDIDLARFGPAAALLRGYDDLDPCYLPDGSICFVSTRYPGIAPDERMRTTNLYVVNADGTDLRRITSERFGADTPAVDPTDGHIVYSRWWRSPPRVTGGDAERREPAPTGSTGYGSVRPTPDPVSPLVLGGIEMDEFPGLNHWFLAGIRPDGSGLEMFSGLGLDRSGTQAYRPAFLADGSALGFFLPTTPFPGAPGNFGLRVFRRGAVAPDALGGPRRFFPSTGPGHRFKQGGANRNGFFYASAAPLPDGRILVTGAPAERIEYDVYVQSGADNRPIRLFGEPGSAELDAVPVVARALPPRVVPATRARMDDFVPRDLEEAVEHGGTFTFLCENIFAQPPVDSPLPGSPTVGKRLFMEFYMNPQRESPEAMDEPILIDRREIGTDGRIEIELPAGVPLFEVIRRADERVALGRDGQIFHVGGHNFGVAGTTARCVGCHAGHSMLGVPEDPVWSNLAPSAVVAANSTRPPETPDFRTQLFFSAGNLSDRRTEPLRSLWVARPGSSGGPALPVSEIVLRWGLPISAREAVIYGVRPDPDRGRDLSIRSLRVRTENGGEIREDLRSGEIRPEGTSIPLDPDSELDTMRITIATGDVAGSLDGVPSLPALAEIEVRARLVETEGRNALFIRSDANCDANFNVTDAIVVLSALFLGGDPLCCEAAADTDDDGRVNLTDAVRTLAYLFRLGEPPPAPFPGCGRVPEESLSCDQDTCR